MKAIILVLGVLATVNLVTSSTASLRAHTEATKIRSDFEKRVKAAIDKIYPLYDHLIGDAEAGYRLKRKALYSSCSALGSAGIKLGAKFEKAIKVYEYAFPKSANLAWLKANLTQIRATFKTKIFTPATSNVTALVSAISKYPKASSCWDDNKDWAESMKNDAASNVESYAYQNGLLSAAEENLGMFLHSMQDWQNSFTHEVEDHCNTNKTCKLDYYTENYDEILEQFLTSRDIMMSYLNSDLDVIASPLEFGLEHSTDQFDSFVNELKMCVDKAKLK